MYSQTRIKKLIEAVDFEKQHSIELTEMILKLQSDKAVLEGRLTAQDLKVKDIEDKLKEEPIKEAIK